MLLQNDDKLAPLLENINMHGIDIKLFKRHMAEKYYSWILCCSFVDSNSLLNNWTSIVNGAALHIQAELDTAIERYNLYIVFFVNSQVPNELKTLIEQDKYSSRKLVVPEVLLSSNDEIGSRIDKLLFSVDFTNNPVDEDVLLKEWLKEADHTFYDLYLQYNDRAQLINQVLEVYASTFQLEEGGE